MAEDGTGDGERRPSVARTARSETCAEHSTLGTRLIQPAARRGGSPSRDFTGYSGGAWLKTNGLGSWSAAGGAVGRWELSALGGTWVGLLLRRRTLPGCESRGLIAQDFWTNI